MISAERVSEDKQNGTNFSFVAPSSEELWVWKEIRSKPWTIVHGLRPKTENLTSAKNNIIGKGFQEEQNCTNFSFIAPSSEELWVRKEIRSKPWIIVHGFRAKTESVNCGQK